MIYWGESPTWSFLIHFSSRLVAHCKAPLIHKTSYQFVSYITVLIQIWRELKEPVDGFSYKQHVLKASIRIILIRTSKELKFPRPRFIYKIFKGWKYSQRCFLYELVVFGSHIYMLSIFTDPLNVSVQQGTYGEHLVVWLIH